MRLPTWQISFSIIPDLIGRVFSFLAISSRINQQFLFGHRSNSNKSNQNSRMKNRITLFSLLLGAVLFVQCEKDDTGGGTDPDITVSTTDFTGSIDENPSAGDMIGTISGSTNSGNVTFTLASESVAGAFNVGSSSGALTVADASLFDFETNPTLSGTVTVANGSVSQTSNITVNVNDVDEMMTTIWSGATMTFSKGADIDPTTEAGQDRITDLVWLTRGTSNGHLYNAKSETEDGTTTPSGTQWAAGTTADSNLSFGTFRELGKPKDQVNKDLVLKLVEENILIDLKFTAWPTGGGGSNGGSGGGFTYERSTQN